MATVIEVTYFDLIMVLLLGIVIGWTIGMYIERKR